MEPIEFEGTIEAGAFDRILAIEALPAAPLSFLGALSSRLQPGGRLFLQLPCHRRYAYALSPAGARWLSLGAADLVPASDLPPLCAPDLRLERHWELSGEHYERTFRAWRRRLEQNHAELLEIATPEIGEAAARRELDAWRLALLAREAMFGLYGGQEWWVSQYALERPVS